MKNCILALLLFSLLLNACSASGSSGPVPTGSPPVKDAGTVAATAVPVETLGPGGVRITDNQPYSAVFPLPVATLIPSPGENLESHFIVLRINNIDTLTGRFGQLTRWLAWSSPAFTVAPDGSFWLADITNRQFRLVHLSQNGGILHTEALDANRPIDVVASSKDIWVLDASNQEAARILQYNQNAVIHKTYTLPADYSISAGLTGISAGPQGELLLELKEGQTIVQFLDPAGEITLKQLPGYSHGEDLYTLLPDEITVNAKRIALPRGEQPGEIIFLGIAPDGSFYIENFTSATDRVVHHYNVQGFRLGSARLPNGYVNPRHTSLEHGSDLALGPDGEVYNMLSTQDQDVYFLRLFFTRSVTPAAFVPPAELPTPMQALRPEWESTPPAGTNEQDEAQNALVQFFSLLDTRDYSQAASLYGGGMEGFDPRFVEFSQYQPGSVEPLRKQLLAFEQDPHEFWNTACGMLLACLSVGQVIEAAKAGEGEYTFWVEFVWGDGARYTTHSCCASDPAQTPMVWQFPVTVRKMDGRFLVMTPPPLLE